MTREKCIQGFESYYGSYVPFVKKMVFDYLRQYDADEIGALFELVLAAFSTSYNKQPDIAVIEKAVNDNPGTMKSVSGIYYAPLGEVMYKGQKIGHMDGPRFLPDTSVLDRAGKTSFWGGGHTISPDAFVRLLPNVAPVLQLEEK